MRKLALLCLGIILMLAVSPTVALGETDSSSPSLPDSQGNTAAAADTETTGIGDVIKSFPSPAGSPAGLAWDGNDLWHADYGTDLVYKIDPATGVATTMFSCPGPSAGGLEWVGGYLWITDAYNDQIYKLDPTTGTVISSFASPGSGPLGLAYDGTYLWNADWETVMIYKINLATGVVVSSFASPDTRPFGLAWDGQYLWLATRDLDKIWKLDPSDGSVITSFDSPGPNPEGLTWDGQYLWNADWIDDMIYQIDAGVPVFQYHFRIDPYINVIHVNRNPGNWLNGYMTGGPTDWNPVLGKAEAGRFYMAIDAYPDQTPGYYEMLFLVGTIATRTGQFIRTVDGLTWDGPFDVTLVPVAAGSEELEGTDITEALGSEVTPQAWYTFQINPYTDIVHLNTNPGGWLNGYDEVYEPDASVLGFAESGRFYFGIDFIHPTQYYTLAFIAGTVSTRDGELIRTIDGTTYDGPIYVWLTPAAEQEPVEDQPALAETPV